MSSKSNLNVNYEDKKRAYMELFRKENWTPSDIKRTEDLHRKMDFLKRLLASSSWIK